MTIHNLSRVYEISEGTLDSAVSILNTIEIKVSKGLDKLTVAFQCVTVDQEHMEQNITITDVEGKLIVRFNKTASAKTIKIQFADKSEIVSRDTCVLTYPDGSCREDIGLSSQIRNVFYLFREAQFQPSY